MASSNIVEFDQYIAPDGQVYQFNNGVNRFVIDQSGTGMPPIDYITYRSPLQNGEVVYDYRLRPRTIQMTFHANAVNRSDYWDVRNKLLDILRPNRPGLVGKLRKRLPNNQLRDIDVVVESGPNFEARDTMAWSELSLTETLRFLAHDPTFYNPTAVNHAFGDDPVTELKFPCTFPILFSSSILNETYTLNYTGTYIAYPKIIIQGPVTGMELTNVSTGKRLRLDYNVSAGETVTITLLPRSKTVTSSVGSQDYIGLLSGDIVTFAISPDNGGTNVLHIVADGIVNAVSVITLSFYTRYIGI